MKSTPPILYAEDNINDAELAMVAFRECKLQNEIIIVRDGLEIIEYLRYQGKFTERPEGNPAFILLDINMPKVDGLEALKIIKQDEKLKVIPVVMLTSSSMERDLVECYQAGVNAYVIKPIKFDEFVDVIKKLGAFWASVNNVAY